MKDSALDKWEYKEHTRVKHILLSKYLKVWITALGKYNEKICYFDGFAGRGEYTDGTLGSPLRALKLADELSEYFKKLICYFVEKDTDNFNNLTEILERERPNSRNWEKKIFIGKKNDEFSKVVNKIFQEMGEGYILAPSFFFIDPFGFSGVPFQVITKILSQQKTEVFFTFMVRDIARFIELPELEETFKTLFVTDKWKAILRSSQKPEVALINLYREQLHEVAKVKYSWAFRVCTSEKVQTLYYLIHSTNNIKGHLAMKTIMFNQSAQGDFAYLGPQDISRRVQMRLFDIENIEELKQYLQERFIGRVITYDKIQEDVCFPWHSEPPYVNTHYNQALKALEQEGKITVERVTSKTARGMSGDDNISFPKETHVEIVDLPTEKINIRPKVHYKEYVRLGQDKAILLNKVNDGSIITRFDRTPFPTKDTDIVCPHFLELKWAYGCPFDCAWCYLKGTFRFQPNKTKPVIKDLNKVELHTRTFLEEVEKPEILNTGEIADSLMGEGLSTPFSNFIIPMFEKQSRHKVLFLTKSDNIKNLLEISPHNQVIVSFSLNADEVAKKWESGAPSVDRRIEAGRKLNEAGYEVRVRIDPMVPVPEWGKLYIELIEQLFSKFVPSRITLGSLRGLQTTINGSTDKSWLEYLKENSNWGKKVDFSIRRNMYGTIIDVLKENYKYTDIGLCKETVAMWGSLGMDYSEIKCNCIW